MSWAEIIGGGEPAKIGEAAASVEEPVTKEEIVEEAKQELSWESAIGLMPTPAAAPVAPPPAAPPAVAPIAAPPSAPPAKEPPVTDTDAPLSWGDIMGGGEVPPDKDKQ